MLFYDAKMQFDAKISERKRNIPRKTDCIARNIQ